MILPDVNVLVGAFRRDSPHYSICRPWLDRVMTGDARFGMSPLALCAVVRLATDERIFESASTTHEAFGYCEDILGHPRCQIVEPGERHWDVFRRICLETKTQGRRITDAWYAALAIEWGCEWITLDRDFARFPGLKWARPTAA
jgi:toxin-antitoxin system PIN domain toxin